MALCAISLALLAALVALAVSLISRHYSYWERKGVPHDKPVWLFGNISQVGKTQTFGEPFRNFYEKYKGKAAFGGFYFSVRKVAVLLDLELVKQVLIKDFSNFANRGQYYNEEDDPLTGHLFNLDGKRWREMRTKLTPTFTALKMQQMLPVTVDIAQRFVGVMRTEALASKKTAMESAVEVKDLLARFTVDVIGSCAFGLDCNSLANPNAEFRVMGRKVFTERRHGTLAFGLIQAFPKLARRLHIKIATDEVHEFYTRVVRETLEYRDKHQIKRNDFFNLLMEMRDEQAGGLTFNEMSAQAFVFLLAGFETSSSTMGFALYELALHPELQQRARAEVETVLAKHGGQMSYEAMKELKYILMIVHETLRLHSIVPLLMRMTSNDYAVPNTDKVIEAGTLIVVPIDAIHYDANIYANPTAFDPERFAPEAVEQRHPMAWLPFGTGPRNCIGLRFGEMQSVVGLAMLLKNFRFSKAKQTPVPLELDKQSFLLSSKGGIDLNVEYIGA